MSEPAQQSFVDVSEAAKILGVSESTVWRQIRRGALPSVLSGGRRRIPKEAANGFSVKRDGERIPAFRSNHPIFRLVGAGRSGGTTPGARDKYGILAE